MWLRLYSVLVLITLTGLSGALVWLLQLPSQPGFQFDAANRQYTLLGYVDFVFVLITAVTILLIITRSAFHTTLQTETLKRFDRKLYRTMYNLPLILICVQCALILFAIFAASLSIGIDFSSYF